MHWIRSQPFALAYGMFAVGWFALASPWLLAYFSAVPSFLALDIDVFALPAVAGGAIIAMLHGRGWHPAGAVLAGHAIAFASSAA